MPRKSRIHFEGAFYHVMLRGNYRQNIFSKKEDYIFFYSLLRKVVDQYGVKIHLFCLMTNHVHLVIEVHRIPLSKTMQSITSTYVRFRNTKLKRQGHLFQGRYHAKLISNDKYLRELCYYIHRNPLAAKMVMHIDDYPWSSHQSYLERKSFDWLTKNHILKILASDRESTKNIYLQFMENHSADQFEFCTFDESGLLIINDSLNKKINTRKSIYLGNLSLNKIAEVICQYTNVSFADLSSPSQSKEVKVCRNLVAYFAHYHGNYQLKQIALLLFREPESISKSLNRSLNSGSSNRSVFSNLIIGLENLFRKLV